MEISKVLTEILNAGFIANNIAEKYDQKREKIEKAIMVLLVLAVIEEIICL